MKPGNLRDRLLRRRVRALKRALPDASAGDASGVHKARVASRRVREDGVKPNSREIRLMISTCPLMMPISGDCWI